MQERNPIEQWSRRECEDYLKPIPEEPQFGCGEETTGINKKDNHDWI